MVTAPLGPRLRLHLRLALARHRRAVIAALVALCVASALSALRPSPPAAGTVTTRVLVARHDLPAGHRLAATDLAAVAWARAALPAGILARPAGRVLAAPLRRGEPVTDVRVAGPRPAAGGRAAPVDGGGGPPGRVVVTVRLSDPVASLLAAPGDHVEVIAGPSLDPVSGAAAVPGPGAAAPGAARVVVRDALVLEVPPSGGQVPAAAPPQRGGLLGALAPAGAPSSDGVSAAGVAGALPAGVLVVAVRPDEALDLAAVTGVRGLSVARAAPGSG